MKLPYNILSKTYMKPRIFLCETDKTRICQLETTATQGTFKFNSYSEISFEVARTYNDLITGVRKVNPFYDKIEALRLIEVESFGYFEIQGPSLVSDGIKEAKSVTAYSLEYSLSQKYLEEFYTVNGRGEWAGSLEDLWQVKHKNEKDVPSIIFYDDSPTPDESASLLHLIMDKVYGWSIDHVDADLCTMSRDFDVDRMSVYDFIMNEICTKFNCYAVFDTINNTISFYAESQVEKFVGDGATKDFTINPPFNSIGAVTIDSYKISNLNYDYNHKTGILSFHEPPKSGEKIEVVNGAMDKWETDVFITFENLSQEINISYDADSIKTVLTVNYGDDGTIREVNLGLPYLTDLSYYYSVDWMGQELYDAYTAYLANANSNQAQFTEWSQKLTEWTNKKLHEENRMSLGYVIADSVNEDTRGTYYIRMGTAPNYTYEEIVLNGSNYNATTTYYMTDGCNLEDGADGNVEALYNILGDYVYYYHRLSLIAQGKGETSVKDEFEEKQKEALKDLNELVDRFEFMQDYNYTIDQLATDLKAATTISAHGVAIDKFLTKMWNELGYNPLNDLYLPAYEQIQTNYVTDGWSNLEHEDYGYYYVTYLFVTSIKNAKVEREKLINGYDKDGQHVNGYQEEINAINEQISALTNQLTVDNYFKEHFKSKYPNNTTKADDSCKKALVRLSAFLREDELRLDDIVEVATDTLDDIYATKRDAMEAGRIELQKLSQPQLQFSMTMANIYALREFDPIINQFQLGKVIKVALRPDYIKQSRLLQVNLNFDSLSDFSCTFGDLTSLRTQSDIHADLLSQAASAGKEVAAYSSYWTKGSDTATAMDMKIEKGLLDAATAIRSIDGTQNVTFDNYGIHLQKVDPTTGEIDKRQGWIVNNQFLYSDDGFETTKAVFGEYPYDNKTCWGLLAEAVIAGYIGASDIEGGTIKIGESKLNPGNPLFEVDKYGNVKMLGGLVEFSENVNSLAASEERLQGQIDSTNAAILQISNKHKYDIKVISDGPTTITSKESTSTLICKVSSWDTDITDTLHSSLFKWKRTSNKPDMDAIWNQMPEHQGVKTIAITHEDIEDDASTSFTCEVDLPD